MIELPDRPYCSLSEAQRFVQQQTGQAKPTFYRDVRNGKYPVRQIAGRSIISTRKLREMFEEESGAA